MIAAPGQRGEAPLPAVFWQRGWRDQESALRAEARELLGWLGLSSHLDRPAGSLSGGQRRLMEIARALMAHTPMKPGDDGNALFTVPGQAGWQLIVNKNPKQWGAFSYDAKDDLGKTALKVAAVIGQDSAPGSLFF